MKLRPLTFSSDRPVATPPIRVDDATTARRLAVRTIFAARRMTVPAAVLMIGHQIGEALVPVVMGMAIDRAIATHDGTQLLLWLVVLGAVFAMLSFSFRFGSRLGLLGMQAVQHQLRTRVTDRILDPRGMAGPARLPGVSLSIATSDVQRLAMACAIGVYPIGQIAAVVFTGIVLLTISGPLGVAVLVGAPTILWILDKAGGPLRARSEHQQEMAGEAAGTATDLVTGFRVVKGIGAEEVAARRYFEASQRALRGVLAASRSEGAYLAAMESVSGLFVVTIGVAAGLMAVSGGLTVGQLITVVGLTQFVMGPLSALGTNAGAVWAGALASARRVLTVLQAPPATSIGTAAATAGQLRFDGLAHGPVRDLDLELPATGLVAVVADAPTTASLVEVLSRSATPENGAVRIGETDLFDLDEDTAIATVRVAPHHAALFEGSVLDNIAAAVDPEAADRDTRITRAVFAAACDDVVEVLPDGLDTPVGEAGRLLSGGQRQRVALARAIAADSSVLVLVDPTTAVDSVTESNVAERLGQTRADGLTLVFTDAPAHLAAADEVIVLAEGRLVHRGAADDAPALSSAVPAGTPVEAHR
ncbi:ABC transporter ATP-binding protein/permease [Rhodococcus sp. HM1]|uniref:ABC transporter ATP-binding protein n=1 Tax=Rhodococcus sp. HM1 TaxID=2937759 RepID=UPI00200B818F|nr:ABC transporter ATP-binding protein [Rhodococcus sp. HM1]MCK8674887.1 ABC transporter ATP-binding protein/permease [Rhodococcus sp. HM1]